MNSQRIKVLIRKRPLNEKEVQKGLQDIVDCHDSNTIKVRENKTKLDLRKYQENHVYCFDAVYSHLNNNEEIYQEQIKPMILKSLQEFNVSFFAYGQTGSGKTFTMMGDPKKDIDGLYLLAAKDIFQSIRLKTSNLKVFVSFYEIYCDKAYDLLNEREECPVRVDDQENVNIIGLYSQPVDDHYDLLQTIHQGLSERVTAQNSQNEHSSRSHAILQIKLVNGSKTFSKVCFIDLAGNERGADVNISSKQTQKDGAEINKSLLALKECIRAMDQGLKHIPFRGSKLTQVLKDCFLGKCEALMISNVSPANTSLDNTLNTLRYADRVMSLSSNNKKKKDEMMLIRDQSKIELVEDKIEEPVFEVFDIKVKKQSNFPI